MGRAIDGDTGALVSQDPNVETNHLSGDVSLTQASTTSHPIPVKDAISPNEGSVTSVNGKRGLTCSICRKRFSRRSRAETCENIHQHKRPSACKNACGASDWYVYFVYPRAAVMKTLFSSASFPSKAGLKRHRRSVETRNRACTKWYVKQLD